MLSRMNLENARNSLVAATFEKANIYVFAAPIIRDHEVGDSILLAVKPTPSTLLRSQLVSCDFLIRLATPYA